MLFCLCRGGCFVCVVVVRVVVVRCCWYGLLHRNHKNTANTHVGRLLCFFVFGVVFFFVGVLLESCFVLVCLCCGVWFCLCCCC